MVDTKFPRRTVVARRGVPPPRQLRSRRTLERILDATQALLEERDFDRLSVQDIVRKAGCSVGAFYGRLRDKEALLDALDERYVEEFATRIEAILEGKRGRQLHDLVREVVESLVGFHRGHRGVIRTLVLRARRAPDRRYRQREQRLHKLVPRLRDLVLEHQRDISHPRPGLAAELGLLMALFTVRELVLWDHLAAIVPLPDRTLVEQLTRAFLAYLGAPLEVTSTGGRHR